LEARVRRGKLYKLSFVDEKTTPQGNFVGSHGNI
jgi:hypothetical protein